MLIGALAVAVSVVAAGPAAAAKGGNNDTAKVCQKGGWKTLVSHLGAPFANQGDCVNDGAQGHSVFTTAGEAACAGIGGAFSVPGEERILWECEYESPPNSEVPPDLVDACVADSDGKGFLDVEALGGALLIGSCHATH